MILRWALCLFLAASCSAFMDTVGLNRREYSVIEGKSLEVCVEALSGNFSTDYNVTLTVEQVTYYGESVNFSALKCFSVRKYHCLCANCILFLQVN